ncbi:MAG: glycoside hydrolase family 15 protein [Pseudomonadota bacterium]
MQNQAAFDRRVFLAGLLSPLSVYACSDKTGHAPALSDLDAWIDRQRALSIEHLLHNISPAGGVERAVETKWIADDRWPLVSSDAAKTGASVRIEEGVLHQSIAARPGSVAAAARGGPDEPDYFFHWVRDSALVMKELAALYAEGPPALASNIERRLADFIEFTRALQLSNSPEGLGEVRFNMDGSQDYLKWSRPQFDGPALRALALLRYRNLRAAPLAGDLEVVLKEAVNADLDYIAANWMRPGFDLWEECKAHDFHTRVVQTAALNAGARLAIEERDEERARIYREAEKGLREALEEYWLADKGAYGFFGKQTAARGDTGEPRAGENFDAAIVTAALHGGLEEGRFSLLDDRILASAVKAEDLFARLYRVNRDRAPDEGVLIGRYEGDSYFGGNPWSFITLEFAEAYYRLSSLLNVAPSLPVTPLNREFFSRAAARAGLKTPLEIGGDAIANGTARAALRNGLVLRGDDMLRAIRRRTPQSGEIGEQLHRDTGERVSSNSLSWSHSSFLAATDARRSAQLR